MPRRTVEAQKKRIRVKRKKPLPRGIKANGSPRKRKSDAAQKAQAENDAKACEMRASGATYQQIADALQYGHAASARRAVTRAIGKVEVEAAKEVVVMDLQLMDEFKMRCLHQLRNNGDLGQIDRIMRIMDFKYRLLGVSDETLRTVQGEFGVQTSVTNNSNVTQIIMPAAETQTEFISKMMSAVGVNPESKEGKRYLESLPQLGDQTTGEVVRSLPMLEGSANDAENVAASAEQILDVEFTEDEPA